ncbi:glycosyltransferase family 4 protein [Pigmentibacter sp. JX0631]|uniref:glycosyltransferase family 4 protein n=1 Tax=Pigmentibacter sp. JX0631 TaxID=2976982 RepID=UPI002469C368|nr:glycosyltransferase family 4 protein [Pigmentibacter sp. JX0631]WGL60383.1 glycosyltransferase family 4 protein [Pigmentibacter sp. JX0631]
MRNAPQIIHVNTSQAFGGLELYTVLLIQKLIENGIKTCLYCLPGSKIEIEAHKLGIKTISGYKQARISLKDIRKLRKITIAENYQIIHTHTRQDVWLASLALFGLPDKKHIFSLYMSAPSKKDFIHKFIYSKIHAITSSSVILNERIKLNYPIPKEQVFLLRYGRDLSIYQKNQREREEYRKKFNITSDEKAIITMCRIDPGKGIKEFAEAFLLLPTEIRKKVHFIIMGEPTLDHIDAAGNKIFEPQAKQLYEWLQDYIANPEVMGRIHLVPFQANFVPFLNASDLFVLATYKETYSLSVLDAMAMGLPVIGTNSGGTPEQVLNNERGLLVEPKNSHAIANAIAEYVISPEKILEHGEKAKNWVYTEHNWKKKISELLNLYYSCLEKQNAHTSI